MLVKVLNFGTNWWSRPRRESEDADSSKHHAAYYNSTGVRCGAKIRRHWVISGVLRFNGAVDFDPDVPERAIGQTFVCSDLTQAFGGNRLLMKGKARNTAVPDRYLVVISSDVQGSIDFASSVWKSVFSSVIAASQLRNMQEEMLLMSPGDWIQTSSGFWQLHLLSEERKSAALVRIGEAISNLNSAS
jgi:hypothetical protein